MSSTCCGPSCSQYPVPSRQFPDCHPERNTRKEVPTRFCCGSGRGGVEGSAVVFDNVTDPVNRRSFDSARVRQWRTRAALRMTAIKGCSTLATGYWLLYSGGSLSSHCNSQCHVRYATAENLENPPVDVPGRHRFRVHHRERGQRCRRHLYLL